LKLDTERRKHRRIKYEAVISHDVSNNGRIYPGKMFNFSKGGMYFESDQTIYPGQDIFVGLTIHAASPGKAKQLLFEVKIVRQEALEESALCCGYGGEFLSTDSFIPETVYNNKKKASSASPSDDFRVENDSRKHIRRPCNNSLIFSYDRHVYKGFVSNIGRAGAFISTNENFDLGGRIKLAIPELKTRKELKITGWIVRISPEGIGISFERRVSRERRSDLDRRTGLDRRDRKIRNLRA